MPVHWSTAANIRAMLCTFTFHYHGQYLTWKTTLQQHTLSTVRWMLQVQTWKLFFRLASLFFAHIQASTFQIIAQPLSILLLLCALNDVNVNRLPWFHNGFKICHAWPLTIWMQLKFSCLIVHWCTLNQPKQNFTIKMFLKKCKHFLDIHSWRLYNSVSLSTNVL